MMSGKTLAVFAQSRLGVWLGMGNGISNNFRPRSDFV